MSTPPRVPSQAPALPPPRACQLCSHGRQLPGGELHCAHERVAGALGLVPCEQARARNGGCGPDAQHLLWPRIAFAGAAA